MWEEELSADGSLGLIFMDGDDSDPSYLTSPMAGTNSSSLRATPPHRRPREIDLGHSEIPEPGGAEGVCVHHLTRAWSPRATTGGREGW